MATIYSADQIIDKSLYMAAGKSINIRTLPDTVNGVIVTNIKGGGFVGVVYSYVTKPDGIWWMIQRDNKKYWCKHYEGAFDIKSLSNQGALTPQQIAERKAEAEKSLGEKAIDKVFGIVKPLAYLIGGVIVASFIFKK